VSATLSIIASGMVTAVGNSGPASLAAIRAGIRGVSEGNIWDWSGGKNLNVGRPTLRQWWEGRDMLAELVAPAIEECCATAERHFRVKADTIPVVLNVAPPDRPLRWPDLDKEIAEDIAHKLGRRLARGSALVTKGRTGFANALEHAGALFASREHALCVVAGVESFLRQSIGDHYMLSENRLLTDGNSNGFTLGEAGAAVLVAAPYFHQGPQLLVTGMAQDHDPSGAGGTEKHPAKADGLTRAIRRALSGAGIAHSAIDLRISDANGEHWKFKEATFAAARLDRLRPAGTPPRRLGFLDH
jgi:3-oxoacyl-[acyl-carrier-protein] synthase-1